MYDRFYGLNRSRYKCTNTGLCALKDKEMFLAPVFIEIAVEKAITALGSCAGEVKRIGKDRRLAML
jgi:hypothetical protein